MRNWVRNGNPESQVYPGLYQKQCGQQVDPGDAPTYSSHIKSLQGYWVQEGNLRERSLPIQTIV